MPMFERLSARGRDRIGFDAEVLIMAGWTGRDQAAVQHHVDELGALGVPPPSRTPLFYRMDPALLCTATTIDVLGDHTSGELETVLIALADGLWVGLGSDHTDRALEAHGVAISKQMCRKPMAPLLWRHEEIATHWDRLVLRAHIIERGECRLYMEAALATVRTPGDLIRGYRESIGLPGEGELPVGTVLFMGALNAIGGIRPARHFEMELEDPVLGRALSHGYEARPIDVIA
jgi:hypothetical protein